MGSWVIALTSAVNGVLMEKPDLSRSFTDSEEIPAIFLEQENKLELRVPDVDKKIVVERKLLFRVTGSVQFISSFLSCGLACCVDL